jgi:hypothetical protein
MGASPARPREAITRQPFLLLRDFPQANVDVENDDADFKSCRQRALPSSSRAMAMFAAVRRDLSGNSLLLFSNC